MVSPFAEERTQNTLTQEGEKPLDQYTEEEMKEMFIDMFFWATENRPEWLQEAIDRKKRMLGKEESERRLHTIK